MSLRSTFSSASINGYQTDKTDYDVQIISGTNYGGADISGDGNYLGIFDGTTSIRIYDKSNIFNFQQSITITSGYFCNQISFNYDGTYLAIGEYEAGAVPPASQVRIFTRSGSTWSLQATITPSDAPQEYFGWSVALNDNGDVLIVGNTEQDTINKYGSCYIFNRSGTTWSQTTKFSQTDLETTDLFGTDVDINGAGDVAVIGAPSSYGTTGRKGKVYTFEDTGTWAQQQKISNPSAGVFDWGKYVSIGANTTTLCATGFKFNVLTSYVGGLGIYAYSAGTWSSVGFFVNPEGVGSSAQPNGYGAGTALTADGVDVFTGGSNYVSGVRQAYIYNYKKVGTYSLYQKFIDPSYIYPPETLALSGSFMTGCSQNANVFVQSLNFTTGPDAVAVFYKP